MTREELRVKAGITTNAIKAINNNEPVSLKVIDKICNVLKCQPGDLVEWIEKQSWIIQENLENILTTYFIYGNILSSQGKKKSTGQRLPINYLYSTPLEQSQSVYYYLTLSNNLFQESNFLKSKKFQSGGW